jgi:hypothetical protein
MLACEALATKAELQELRNQINQLLGKKEGGGFDDVLQMGSLGSSTILGGGVLLAQTAIQDIKVQGIALNSTADDMAKAFADGSAQWVKIKGTGSTGTPLPDLSKIAKNTASTQIKTTAVAGAAATATAATMGTVASLGLSVVGLGLAIKNRTDIIELEAEQQATDKVLSLHEQEFTNLNKVLGKYGKDLNQANQAIDNLEAELTQTNQNSQVLQQNITTQQLSIQILEDNLTQSEETVNKVLEDLATTQTNLEQFKADAGEDIDILQTNVGVLQKSFEQQKEATQTMYEIAEKQGIRIANLEGNQTELIDRVTNLHLTQSVTKAEMDVLIQDLQEENDLQTAKSQGLAARLAVLEKTATNGTGGGTNVNVVESVASTQQKMLETMNKLGTTTDEEGNEVKPIPAIDSITTSALLNGDTDYFDDIFSQLFDQLPTKSEQQQEGEPQVTQEELEAWGIDFKDLIKDDMQTVIAGVIAATVTPLLNQIQTQTVPSAISEAVGTEICNQAQSPNSCITNNITNPINNQLGNIANGLGLGLDATNLGFSATILGQLMTLKNFLQNAWNSTFMDKILNGVNTVLAFHNALMLSRNLGQTIGDTATLFLEFVNIKDSNGESIDVNSWISTHVKALATAILGEEQYKVLVTGFNAANRILTAGRGMLSALNGIKDALQEGQELIANRVGTLGNAFLEHGYFEDDFYSFMSNEVNLRQPFSKFTNYVANLTELVEEVGELIEQGIEVQEAVNEFKESQGEFKTASAQFQKSIDDWSTLKSSEEAEKKMESESPEIANSDLIEGETEEV